MNNQVFYLIILVTVWYLYNRSTCQIKENIMANTDSQGCLIGIDLENQTNTCSKIKDCLGISNVSCGWCKSSKKAFPHGTISNHNSTPCVGIGKCSEEDWITFHFNWS